MKSSFPTPLGLATLTAVLLLGVVTGCRPADADFTTWQSPAARDLRERLAREPNDAAALYWRGYAASHIGDLATVHRSYRAAIRLAPQNEWYRISYGWALFNAGAFAAARDQWLSAYDFCKGNHRESAITVALGYHGTRQFEQAAAFYDQHAARDAAFASFDGLQRATAHWTWREKTAVYDLFDIWRYSYRD